ncbi:MAG: DUF459 domain-containing protein [Firmicutes bacterium]|nr:DUF459 domain-containing protein [Bacillota bacterium]
MAALLAAWAAVAGAGPARAHGGPCARGACPAAAPAPARRSLTLLVVGDSLGEDLEYGLADILPPADRVHLVEAAVGSSGLDEPQYYDWPVHLALDLVRDRPDVVVVLIGANDTLSFYQDGRYAAFGGALWRRDYGGRVARMMAEATGAKARVLWVGLPVMAPWSVLANRNIETLNALYAAQARAHCGVSYLSTWRLFQGPRGGFTPALRAPDGQILTVRDPDGVHIAPAAGDELVATAVLAALDRTWGFHLCPAGGDPWRRLAAAACRIGARSRGTLAAGRGGRGRAGSGGRKRA